MRSQLDPELIFVIKHGKRNGRAVDVGANGGIYSYAFSKIFDRVEAFEPNQSSTENLYSLSSPKIILHHEALSDQTGIATLYTPVSSSGVEYSGWGSLHQETLPAAGEVRAHTVTTQTMDSYDFEDVVLIKIDVESHEQHVLNGASRTIERCRPILLIEAKPPARAQIWDFFISRNYHCFALHNGGLQPLDSTEFASVIVENFFWIPVELLGSLTWSTLLPAVGFP
jgi:FkbM family methyltransferase